MATLILGLSDFIWAVRQINYCLAAIGASPSRQEERDIKAWTTALTLVLRSFSVGVRSDYFTMAAALWFVGQLGFIVCTSLAVGLPIWRQTWSDTASGITAIRKLLDDGNAGGGGAG